MDFQMLMYLSVLLFTSVHGKIQKIIGGENVDIIDFPYMVSLRYLRINKHFCGGAIISNFHILTAAHCVYNAEAYYSEIIIYTGSSSSVHTNVSAFRIQQVDIPFGYNVLSKPSKDLAVITLQDSIIYNEYQKNIQLPIKDVHANAIGVITGWGVSEIESQTPSAQLQKASMKIIDKSKCQNFIGSSDNDNFCAFQKNGVGVCIGDSGGPLVIDGKVVGISSFTIPCAKGYPDVYTNVYSQLEFINSILKNCPFSICLP